MSCLIILKLFMTKITKQKRSGKGNFLHFMLMCCKNFIFALVKLIKSEKHCHFTAQDPGFEPTVQKQAAW